MDSPFIVFDNDYEGRQPKLGQKRCKIELSILMEKGSKFITKLSFQKGALLDKSMYFQKGAKIGKKRCEIGLDPPWCTWWSSEQLLRLGAEGPGPYGWKD